MKSIHIAIVGLGRVGRRLATSLIRHMNLERLTLCTRSYNHGYGFVRELIDSKREINPKLSVDYVRTPSDIMNADWVVLCASERFKDYRKGNIFLRSNDRLNEYHANVIVVRSIVHSLVESIDDAKILVVTNPVDLITHYVKYRFPDVEVFGFGNSVDAKRMMYILHDHYGLRDIEGNAIVFGEHGECMVPILSQLSKDSIPLSDFIDPYILRRQISAESKQAIITEGHTASITATSLESFFRSILNKRDSIETFSYYIEDYLSVSDVTVGVPFKISKGQIEGPISYALNEIEIEMFQRTTKKLKLLQNRYRISKEIIKKFKDEEESKELISMYSRQTTI